MAITELFYDLGGYDSSSANVRHTAHIAVSKVTGTYIPFAVEQFNIYCKEVRTLSVADDTTGQPYDDRIIAHLALAYADTEYDHLSGDPDAGAGTGRHQSAANTLILNAYGVRDRYGRMVFPCHADEYRACGTMAVPDSSY
jgi:hypothetical protein